MQRHHTGSGRRRPIPSDWATGPTSVIGLTLASTVRIGTVSDEPQWNEARGQSESGGLNTVYAGPASIMAADEGRTLTVAEDAVTSRVYDITVALARTGADLIVAEHVVLVEACDDQALVGRRLQVHEVERGSRRFSRVLLATLVD